MNTYRLGKTYVDKAARNHPDDQFLGWVNIDGSGMGNSAGIRPLRYLSAKNKQKLPALVILVTHDKSGGHLNPWDDVVDYSASQITYWGDAKSNNDKRLNDFPGNRALRKVFDYVLTGKTELTPPILHFSKPKTGIVRFNGLCILNKLDISWFDDHGSPVQNYHAHLTILDCDEVCIDWLHHRIRATSEIDVDSHKSCPTAWKNYKKGNIQPINVWAADIKSKDQQLPAEGSADQRVIDELLVLSPYEFEHAIVSIFSALTDVTHNISATKPTADGGIDFFGTFRLPNPVNYEISFRGEVKRYARTTAVDPKSVSRLVARLGRQEYGIFVTTSYFTKAAQREVLADGYPVHLISGVDLLAMMKHLRIVSNGRLNQEWLNSMKSDPA